VLQGFHDDYTLSATGGSVDLVRNPEMIFEQPATGWYQRNAPRLENVSLDPDAEVAIIEILDEERHHKVCTMHPIMQFRRFTVSTHLAIRSGPGTVFCVSSQHGTLFRITKPFGCVVLRGWWHKGEILTARIRYGPRLLRCLLSSSHFIVFFFLFF
jgi:hypothetical protein